VKVNIDWWRVYIVRQNVCDYLMIFMRSCHHAHTTMVGGDTIAAICSHRVSRRHCSHWMEVLCSFLNGV
jgi:hypothetical protein